MVTGEPSPLISAGTSQLNQASVERPPVQARRVAKSRSSEVVGRVCMKRDVA